MLCGADHQYPIVSLALLLVKYMRIASIMGYGVQLSGAVHKHMVLICKIGR
jgi:hypothetical protein